MKLAIASNNGTTIQRHFGRTHQYVVVSVDDGQEVDREVRSVEQAPQALEIGSHDEAGHHHRRHRSLVAPVADCDVLIAGGMGRPMAQAAQQAGLELILTNERLVDDIVAKYLDGSLEHKPDLAHEPGH